MIYKNNSFQNWLKTVEVAIVLFVSFLLLIIYASALLKEEKLAVVKAPKLPQEKENPPIFDLPKQREMISKVSMDDLRKSLKVFRMPPRPFQKESGRLFFELDKKLYPMNCFKMYLGKHDNQLILSDKASDSFIEIEDIEVSSLNLKQVCYLDKPFNKTLQKNYRLPISTMESSNLLFEKPFLELKNSEYLGLDKLSEYRGDLGFLIKINDVIYKVQKNTSLFFENKWKVGSSLTDPCAFIQEATPDEIIIELWGQENDNYLKTSIKKKFLPKKSLRITDFVTDVHMRGKNQISALLEKQKIFLHENDIAVKRGGKWIIFNESFSDDKNEMYIILKKIKKNREIEINILEKNRILLHNFTIPVSRGSFAKKSASL